MPLPQVYINNQLIDLPDSELKEILSTHAITDAENIEARASSVSTVLKAPGTRKNRLVFGNLHLAISDDNIVDGSPARIEFGGRVILNGKLRYVKTVRKGNSIEFHFIIIGQNSWKENLPKKSLKDLNLTAYNHYLSAEAIIWSQQNTDKSIFLYTNPQPRDTGYIMPVDYHMALNVRRLFKEIFKQEGYRVVSEFIDSDFFSRLWFHPMFIEKDSEIWKTKSATAGNSAPLSHGTPAPSGGGSVETIYIANFLTSTNPEQVVSGELKNTGFRDDYGHFNTSTGIYTASKYGSYNIEFNIEFSFLNPSDQTFLEFYIDDVLLRRSIYSSADLLSENVISETFESTLLKAGQGFYFKMYYEHNYISDSNRLYQADRFNATLSIEANTTLALEEKVNIQEYYLRSDELQMSFIKDCITLFNLQIATDESLKTVYIEPEGNFYGNEVEQIDYRIAKDRTTEIYRTGSVEAKTITFKYKGENNGREFKNGIGSTDTKDISLSFFTKSNFTYSILQYAGVNVLEGSGKNNLFFFKGLKDVQDYQIWRFNNDHLYQEGNGGSLVGLVGSAIALLPNITFSDQEINLNFENYETNGLCKLFYSSTQQILNSQKTIVTHLHWNVNQIGILENSVADANDGFRKRYFSHEHGKLRLIKVSNFDTKRSGPTKTKFVQDIHVNAFEVTPTDHQSATSTDVVSLISYVSVDIVDPSSDPVQIGYQIAVEQIGGVSGFATIYFPHFQSINYLTVKTTPNNFAWLKKTTGSGSDLAVTAIRNNDSVFARIVTPSLNPQGQNQLQFFSNQHSIPMHVCAYGYYNKFSLSGLASNSISISVRYRTVFSYPNCSFYAQVIINDDSYNTPTTGININQDVTQTVDINVLSLNEGINTYTINLYANYSGSYQLVDTLTAKLYCHG